MAHVLAHLLKIEMLEASVARRMEKYHYHHDFRF
jgi:hypothetical protein